MALRKMKLPEGWYPHDPAGTEEYFSEWERNMTPPEGEYYAGIVPHAGWYFSGEEAWRVVRNIPRDVGTVIIAGGHLLPGQPRLCWEESSYETPHGRLELNEELFDRFCRNTLPDYSADNTIEIQLPLISYRIPKAKILAARLPPTSDSFEWGKEVGGFCRDRKIRAFFLGSTDLTHYGHSYGNMLYKDQQDPVRCASEKDRELLENLRNAEYTAAIDSVGKWHTACSLGGALGAAGFASVYNKIPGRILSLTGSYTRSSDDSTFVNYGTVLF